MVKPLERPFRNLDRLCRQWTGAQCDGAYQRVDQWNSGFPNIELIDDRWQQDTDEAKTKAPINYLSDTFIEYLHC